MSNVEAPPPPQESAPREEPEQSKATEQERIDALNAGWEARLASPIDSGWQAKAADASWQANEPVKRWQEQVDTEWPARGKPVPYDESHKRVKPNETDDESQTVDWTEDWSWQGWEGRSKPRARHLGSPHRAAAGTTAKPGEWTDDLDWQGWEGRPKSEARKEHERAASGESRNKHPEAVTIRYSAGEDGYVDFVDEYTKLDDVIVWSELSTTSGKGRAMLVTTANGDRYYDSDKTMYPKLGTDPSSGVPDPVTYDNFDDLPVVRLGQPWHYAKGRSTEDAVVKVEVLNGYLPQTDPRVGSIAVNEVRDGSPFAAIGQLFDSLGEAVETAVEPGEADFGELQAMLQEMSKTLSYDASDMYSLPDSHDARAITRGAIGTLVRDDILPGASVLRLAQENIPKEPGTASYKTQVEAYALGAKNALSGFKTNLLDIGRSLAENPPADPGDIPNLPNNRKREIVAAKAKIDTAISVLPIVGVIEWAERSMPDNPVADTNDPTIYSQAVQSVIESFEQTLIGMGFERISTVGQRFDPRLHEAVNAEAISGEGAVIRSERQAGYRLGDFIIAPKVVVESQ